jgi:hypothetical protein
MPNNPSYIQANRDFYMVELEGDGPEYWREPILGWQIHIDNGHISVSPVTVTGIWDHATILYPDGRVRAPYECTFNSAGEWVAAKMRMNAKGK